MNFLITGGHGALGYHLTKKLKEDGHHVTIYDRVPTWMFAEGDVDLKADEFIDATITSIGGVLHRRRDYIIIHAAEYTCPDIGFAANMIYDNVAFTTQLLQECAARGMRCLVLSWDDNLNVDTFFIKTIKWKEELVHYFNKGNAVLNVLRLPRLIGPYFAETSYGGSFVKRVYNSAVHGRMCITHEHEFVARYLTEHWSDVEDTVDEIIEMSMRRTRETHICAKNIARMHMSDIVEIIIEITGVESITIFDSRKDEIIIPGTIYGFEKRISLIKPVIERCVDVWQRADGLH